MGYKQFKFNLLLRIAAIVLSVFLLADFFNESIFQPATWLLVALVVFQLISLIKFLDQRQIDLEPTDVPVSAEASDHLNVVNDGDPVDQGAYQKLHKKFTDLKNDKDAQSQYLKTIVQYLGIGLLTFNKQGDVQIINATAKKLLRVNQLKNISGLTTLSEPLVESFKTLKTGGQDLIKIQQEEGYTIQLSVYAIELTLKDENFKLITLQNIQSELEEKEMEAWQNLIRVLTHEIMNSVTPISSLAATVDHDLMESTQIDDGFCRIEREDLRDIHMAIQTIQRRSAGLIRFVSDFRNLTRIPIPKLKMVRAQELFDRVLTLLKNDMEENEISVQTHIDESDLSFQADPELIEQVMINIIKNAIQALDDEVEDKLIEISAQKDDKNNTTIRIKDNGPGIDEEALGKIFIPFFTTKKNGSGIGLSLSKQIMRQHKGAIKVVSNLDEGTEFSLRFREPEPETADVF